MFKIYSPGSRGLDKLLYNFGKLCQASNNPALFPFQY